MRSRQIQPSLPLAVSRELHPLFHPLIHLAALESGRCIERKRLTALRNVPHAEGLKGPGLM